MSKCFLLGPALTMPHFPEALEMEEASLRMGAAARR